MEILVTGGTGTLGQRVVAGLRSRDHSVRVLSRKVRPDVVTGDLVRNIGLESAVDGADVIVHCATGRDDVRATTNLVNAAAWSGSPHFVYISIVGVDRIPFFYYQQKLRSEQVIEQSGLPFTLLRATQFHTLVASIFEAQRRLPFLLTPSIPVQPVDVSEVADVLSRLATAEPAGRVPDFGGPERRAASDFAGEWQRAEGLARKQVPMTLPGRTFRALGAGFHTTPQHVHGKISFAQFLDARRSASSHHTAL